MKATTAAVASENEGHLEASTLSASETRPRVPASIKALAWSSFGQAIAQPVTIGVGIVLARLLSPSDFGTLAAASIFTTVISVFGALGIQTLMLREKTVDKPFLEAMLGLSLAAATVCGILVFFAAGFLGGLAQSTNAVPALRALSLAVFGNVVSALPQGLLVREMRQKDLALGAVWAAIGSSLVALALALLRYGYWALVASSVVAAAISTAYVWWCSGLTLTPILSWGRTRSALAFGFQVSLNESLIWGSGVVDKLIVARGLGEMSLGYYSFAFNLAELARKKLFSAIEPVVQADIAGNIRQQKGSWQALCEATKYTTLILWLPLAILGASAVELIGFVYGAKWSSSILPLRILVAAMGVSAIGGYSYKLYALCNRASWYTGLIVARMALTVALILPLLGRGLPGVTLGYALGTVSLLPLEIWLLQGLLGGRGRDFLLAILPATAATGTSATIGVVVRQSLLPAWSQLAVLVATVLAVSGAYALVLYIAFPKVWSQIWADFILRYGRMAIDRAGIRLRSTRDD